MVPVEVVLKGAGLTERRRTVIKLRYGLGGEPSCTLHDVARRLGIRVKRVPRIECEAVRKLSQPRRD